jgi:hypothetical protein
MKMQPDRIEDLIAATALYRPGPMELIHLLTASTAAGRPGSTRSWTIRRNMASWSTRNR